MDTASDHLARERTPGARLISRACLCLSIIASGLALRRYGLGLGLPTPIVKYGGSMLWGMMVFFLVAMAASHLSRRAHRTDFGLDRRLRGAVSACSHPLARRVSTDDGGCAAVWPRLLNLGYARLCRRDRFGNAARSFRRAFHESNALGPQGAIAGRREVAPDG
jgi:hypothetical protein